MKKKSKNTPSSSKSLPAESATKTLDEFYVKFFWYIIFWRGRVLVYWAYLFVAVPLLMQLEYLRKLDALQAENITNFLQKASLQSTTYSFDIENVLVLFTVTFIVVTVVKEKLHGPPPPKQFYVRRQRWQFQVLAGFSSLTWLVMAATQRLPFTTNQTRWQYLANSVIWPVGLWLLYYVAIFFEMSFRTRLKKQR